MRILFYIPTFTDVTAPLLGIPSLTAYLDENGISDYHVTDLNLEILDHLVESDYLDNQAQKVIQDFENLNSLNQLSDESVNDYENVYPLYNFCMSKMYHKLGDYLQKLREPGYFYNVSYYILHIKGFFDNCFKLINYKSSLGLDYLFACRMQHDLSEKDELFHGFYTSRILPQLRELKPEVVGFSVCYSDQFVSAMYLAKLIKKEFPDIHIVMGGTHLNVLKDRHLTCEKEYFTHVDSYLLGEGENPFLMLIRELDTGGDLSQVPNIIYLKNNTITENPSLPDLPINSLPMPNFTCLPLKRYLSPSQVIPYRITRGCYWNKCAFCVHFQTKHFSFKSADRVIEDIKVLKKTCNTNNFYFVDDSIPKAFLDKFMKGLEEENVKITWVGNIRCDNFMTTEFIAKLAKSGCRQLYLGIESGSQRILDLIKKGIDIQSVERIINDCHHHSISIKMNFIKGLPLEDKEDIDETIGFIKRVAKNSDIIAVTPLGIGENTDIYKDPEAFGIEVLEEKDPSRLFLSFRRTKGLTSVDEINRLYDCHTIIFDRFTFFNRIHHFLFVPKFPKTDFEELTSRLYLISDQVGNYLIRDMNEWKMDEQKKPKFCNNHQPQLLNYNIKQLQNRSGSAITARQTIYLYSLLNFDFLVDINPFTYQLLTLCDGEKTVNEIRDHFVSKFPNLDIHQLETQTFNTLTYLYKYKVIDFI